MVKVAVPFAGLGLLAAILNVHNAASELVYSTLPPGTFAG
jgi:hypothetical protein